MMNMKTIVHCCKDTYGLTDICGEEIYHHYLVWPTCDSRARAKWLTLNCPLKLPKHLLVVIHWLLIQPVIPRTFDVSTKKMSMDPSGESAFTFILHKLVCLTK